MLTELASRILAELEEAGEEYPAAMLNSVLDPVGSDREIIELQSALRQLIANGFVALSIEIDASGRLVRAPVPISLTEVDVISTWLKFDPTKKRWFDARVATRQESYPQIVLTPDGRKASVKVLTERGYQWWRRK